MVDVVKALQMVREVYVNFPKRMESAQEELRKIESEIQDILHVIELTNFNACDGYKWAKELQTLRHQRRMLKDEIDLLEPIAKDFLSFQKPTEKNINKTLGEIRNVVGKQNNRSYRMRVREELQELMK